MAKDIPLDTLLGITKEPVETLSHADMLRQNLNKTLTKEKGRRVCEP